MRILLVTQYYWPETFIINDLTALLKLRGAEVTVLTGKPNYPEGRFFDGYDGSGVQYEVHDGVPIIRLPIVARGKNSRIRLALNYLSFMASGFFVGPRTLRGHQYDIVFVYAPSPLLQALPAISLARRRKVPITVWVQDLWPESLTFTGHVKWRWLVAAVRCFVRIIYRSCDSILIQSRAFSEPVSLLTDDPSKIVYFPNFYKNIPIERPSAAALELIDNLRSKFSVVFAGNLGSAQALDTVLEAAHSLRDRDDICFCLVGSGSRDEWLRDQCASLGLNNVFLAGRFEPGDMPAIFDASQALLVSLKLQNTPRVWQPTSEHLLRARFEQQHFLAARLQLLQLLPASVVFAATS